MDFEWVAIALGDVSWITLAFLLGLGARLIGLPPLIGFLVAGFILNGFGVASGEMLEKLADLGITLLLFTIGLKLKVSTLAKPQVWAVTSIHTLLTTLLFTLLLLLLATLGVSLFDGMALPAALTVAFALSFSSTVFVVKVLEEKGEMASLHGGVAIGILIMQDIAAVVFIVASTGKIPSPLAILLFGLLLLRPLFGFLLRRAGHGELLILYGFSLALGGAILFELVGLKGDLGALLLGVLLSSHPKASELAKSMLGFKDLLLVGFFLTIGLHGHPSLEMLLLGLFLALLVVAKSALFFALLVHFNLRARTALLTSLNLTNYSEFGLIVAAIATNNGLINSDWLVVIAVAMSFTFVIAAPLNARSHQFYNRYRTFWKRFQRGNRLPDDAQLHVGEARVVIFGMGRVGTGAYDKIQALSWGEVIGVDFDLNTVIRHRHEGRNVLQGDPTDADFWDRVKQDDRVDLVMLAMPNFKANHYVITHLKARNFSGTVAATARYPDEVTALQEAGADAVFNIYAEAGVGFAEHALDANQE